MVQNNGGRRKRRRTRIGVVQRGRRWRRKKMRGCTGRRYLYDGSGKTHLMPWKFPRQYPLVLVIKPV